MLIREFCNAPDFSENIMSSVRCPFLALNYRKEGEIRNKDKRFKGKNGCQ